MTETKTYYFNGKELTKYGGYLHNDTDGKDYLSFGELARTVNAIRCNNIVNLFWTTVDGDYIEPELISGEEDDDTEYYQYYIVDSYGIYWLEKCNQNVWYLEALDMYVWGVTHYGTDWNYVPTSYALN